MNARRHVTESQPRIYDYKEVVRSYLMFRECENAHADLAEFHDRRFRVVCSLFGIDPSSFHRRDDLDGLPSAFRRTAEHYSEIQVPLSGYLEAPQWLADIPSTFRTRIRPLVDQQKQITFELLCVMFVAMYGESDIRISDKDLRRHGIDDRKAPDPIDYW